MFSSGSLCPQPLFLPSRNARATASWTCLSNRTDFASWGGALPLSAFSLLPFVCSLSTLLLCLHPAMCELQWIYVMASCCGLPGGPSAMLLSMFWNGWVPFKEIKHWRSPEWGCFPAPETSCLCRLPPLTAHGIPRMQRQCQWCQAPRLCNFPGFFFSNWVVGGRQHQPFSTGEKGQKSSFLLMSLPVLVCFILKKFWASNFT